MNKEEFMKVVGTYTGDRNDDTTIEFVEKMSKTFDELSADGGWEAKYHENDEAWRKRYKNAFFGKKAEPEPAETIEPTEKTFDNLFKKG